MELNLNTDYIYDINRSQFATILQDFRRVEGERKVEYRADCSLAEDGEIESASDIKGRRKAIYLGKFLNIWGHCITDNLKKFWFLLTPEYQSLKNEGFVLVCTLYKDSRMCMNFIELISFFGLEENDVTIIKEKTTFEKLIVPEDSLNHYHWYYQEFKDTIDHIVSQVQSDRKCPEKIYFSRTQLKDNGRRDFGEYMIEDAFRKAGYSIVCPEKFTLREQLVMLKSCDSFAATDGSVAHNAMFCSDGIECIVISKMCGAIPYQYSIMGMRQFKSYYIDSHLSIFNVFAPWHGPFYMFVSDSLAKFFQDRGIDVSWNFSVLLYMRYFVECLYEFIRYRLRVKVNSNSKFYSDMLVHCIFRKLKCCS